MHNKPYKNTKKDILSQNAQPFQHIFSKHGLNIPTLIHITSYLDPPSLFNLSAVNTLLHDHIKDDYTWRAAFLLKFMGIKPESELANQCLTIRRTESSWKKEYVVRYNIRRRWERTRSPTVTNVPVHSNIAQTHMLPSGTVLCSSLKYGIVSRYLPLTGKVVKGYLTPSGTGLGIGNPNAEFSPDVTACDISSEGGTAKIAWGFRNGQVAITTAARADNASNRTASKTVRCILTEIHGEEVVDIRWDSDGAHVLSGGMDGTVKLWDASTAKCLWTSLPRANLIGIHDRCLRITSALQKGIIVGGMLNGDIFIWSGFDSSELRAGAPIQLKLIITPCLASATSNETSESPIIPSVSSLYIDASSPTPSVLVAFAAYTQFFRIDLDGAVTIFKDDTLPAPITSITPAFASKAEESSFVIVGDQLGFIVVFPWKKLVSTSVTQFRKFEANVDSSAVTAVAWNDVILAVGSTRGTTSVFDAYTFELLKTFSRPAPRSYVNAPLGSRLQGVSNVMFNTEKDIILVTVGDRVMTWKALPVSGSSGGVRGRSGGAMKRNRHIGSVAKGYEIVQLRQTVSESLEQLDDERDMIQQKFGREREHRSNLERLGLDEVGALQYALMLSRDEAQEAGRNPIEDGVFEGDFDDIPQQSTSSFKRSWSPTSPSSRPQGSPTSGPGSIPLGRPIPGAVASSSNRQIQVSPRYKQEVGSIESIPLLDNDVVNSGRFPPISKSASPPSKHSPSAWSKPLTASPTSARSLGSRSIRSSRSQEGDDADLRLAIELSLAEARSLGISTP